MIEIPVEDYVFAFAALVGGVLLLLTVVFDDILGGILDSFGLEFGGTSVTPLLLGFIAMFGAGGLVATQVFDVHGGQAALVAAISGVAGAALAGGLFAWLRRSESEEPFSLADLVGDSGYVSVGIPAGRYGSVLVHAEGQAHEFAATSGAEIAAGTTVRITGIAGTGLLVEPAGQTVPAAPADPAQ